MKKRILSVLAVFMLCCTAMLTFVGCEEREYGTLTSSAGATVLQVTYDVAHPSQTSVASILEANNVTFTYVVPASENARANELNFSNKKYNEVPGITVSGFVTSAGEHELIVIYRGAECKIKYTVTRVNTGA